MARVGRGASSLGVFVATMGLTLAGVFAVTDGLPAHAPAGAGSATVSSLLAIRRTGPSTHGGWASTPLVRGVRVALQCWSEGTPVSGDRTWYATQDGRWLPAEQLRVIGPVSPCAGEDGPMAISASELILRSGPSTGDQVVQRVPKGSRVQVSCRLGAGRATGRSRNWFRTAQGHWVSSAQLPMNTEVPRCAPGQRPR